MCGPVCPGVEYTPSGSGGRGEADAGSETPSQVGEMAARLCPPLTEGRSRRGRWAGAWGDRVRGHRVFLQLLAGSCAFARSPTIRICASPSLNRISVGILITSKPAPSRQVVVDVELGDWSTGLLPGDLLEDGGDHLARATPLGPEVDQYRSVGRLHARRRASLSVEIPSPSKVLLPVRALLGPPGRHVSGYACGPGIPGRLPARASALSLEPALGVEGGHEPEPAAVTAWR